MVEAAKTLVERLFAVHRAGLQAFFYRRTKHSADATDLAQEVYVRMLRIRDLSTIRNSEAYLYAVARNLATERAALDRRQGIAIDIEHASVQEELVEHAGIDSQIDATQRVKRLREVLRQLPPKCHATVVLQYVHGLTHQEIAERLEVSPRMVKKYLAQALGHCRRRMARLG